MGIARPTVDWRAEAPWYGAGAVIAVLGGFLVVYGSMVTILGGLLAVGALAVILTSARVRFIVVLAGALLVFQSEANAPKIAYLGLLLVCLFAALPRLLRTVDPIVRAAYPMIAGGLALIGVVACTLVVSHSEGIPTTDWVRDALTYFMLVALPLIGLEASLTVPRRALATILVVFGTIAAIGFATDWLNRRGLVEGLGRFVLASACFSILAFSYAAIRSLTTDRHRVWWFVLASFIAGALLITGTRTNVVLLAAAVIGMAGAQTKFRVPLSRMLGFVAALAAISLAMLPLLERYLFTEQGFLQERFEGLLTLFGGSIEQDQSFQLRSLSYALAQNRWHDHLWTGGGLGYTYPNGLFTLDTPWMMPAKFGIIGTTALLFYLTTVIRSVTRMRRASGYSIELTMARSWGFAMVALIPFGPFVEDKGTSLALMVVIAMVASAGRERLPHGGDVDDNGHVDVPERRGVGAVRGRVSPIFAVPAGDLSR